MGLIPRDYYIQTWELRHLVFTHILLKPLCGFELTWTWILGEFTTWSLLKELGDLGFPTKGADEGASTKPTAVLVFLGFCLNQSTRQRSPITCSVLLNRNR